MNTGAVPDTEVFSIGDGQASPWFLIDDNAARFITNGTDPYQYFISRNNIPGNLEFISDVYSQAKISASVYYKFSLIRSRAVIVSSTPTSNVGAMYLSVVSNGVLNTAISMEGVAGSSAAAIGFFGHVPAIQQNVATENLANLYTALKAYGLIV